MNKIAVSPLGVENKEEFLNKLDKIVKKHNLQKYVSIHYDYVDNIMYKGTKCDIEDLKDICNYDFDVSVHLMANDINDLVDKCVECDKENIINIALQYEIDDIENKIKLVNNRFNTYLVLNPNIEYNNVKYLDKYISGYLLMSVYPGIGGQEYIDVTNKLKDINKSVMIDGGINDITILNGIDKIDTFVVGSYLTKDINKLEENLLKLVRMK